jgi:hypothetical protein
MALVCNCKRVVSRGDGPFAEYRVVRSRKWDCPSCGLDRKRTLAQMCSTASVARMLTLTIEQPRAHFHGAAPGELPDGVQLALVGGQLVPIGWGASGLASIPERHRPCTGRKGDAGCLKRKRQKDGGCLGCDPSTHLAWNARNGGVRWRVLPDCTHCARWVSKQVRRFVRKVRVEYPEFDYLQVREVHKSGGVHVHMAVVGLSRVVTRRSQAGKDLKRFWAEVGGGHLDVGKHGEHPAEAAGWYIGKYLAKVQDDVFAKGFRRWSRAAKFAPEVRMSWTPPEDHDGGWDDPHAALRLGGWVHPDGTEHKARWRRDQQPAEYRTAVRPPVPVTPAPWRCPTWQAIAPVLGLPDGLSWASEGARQGARLPVTQAPARSAATGLDSRTAKCTQARHNSAGVAVTGALDGAVTAAEGSAVLVAF